MKNVPFAFIRDRLIQGTKHGPPRADRARRKMFALDYVAVGRITEKNADFR